jgi:hypothetical protein
MSPIYLTHCLPGRHVTAVMKCSEVDARKAIHYRKWRSTFLERFQPGMYVKAKQLGHCRRRRSCIALESIRSGTTGRFRSATFDSRPRSGSNRYRRYVLYQQLRRPHTLFRRLMSRYSYHRRKHYRAVDAHG